jgi:acetyl-CoA carboxylase carboxyltransferase component
MANPQDQYTEALRSSQEAVAGALDGWTKAATQAFGMVPNAPLPAVDPAQVIDQVFDFAERLLESQRQFAKSLAEASAQVSDTMRQQAESTAGKAAETARRSSTK